MARLTHTRQYLLHIRRNPEESTPHLCLSERHWTQDRVQDFLRIHNAQDAVRIIPRLWTGEFSRTADELRRYPDLQSSICPLQVPAEIAVWVLFQTVNGRRFFSTAKILDQLAHGRPGLNA